MQSLQKQAPYWKAPHGQLGLVELDAVHTGVDLDPDHGLEVLAPDRVVAVHVEALVLAVGALHPVGVAGLAVDVAGHALLDEVGDRLAVGVDQPAGEVVLDRLPQLRVAVGAELAQPHPAAPARAAQLVDGEDGVLLLGQLDGELPALSLEDDAEHLDAPLVAGGDELAVVDEAVEARAGVDRAERLLFEVGQGQRAAAHGRPHQHGRAVVLKVVDHAQAAGRQARVIAVLAGEPGVEVDTAVHGQGPPRR
ncbi:hypothetical protein [Nonomuraea salmonea]|uniref:hypothetical protein n=1 Tax=Nonomuraea salmonea TaxID=46181 RepID=UPI002FEB21C8